MICLLHDLDLRKVSTLSKFRMKRKTRSSTSWLENLPTCVLRHVLGFLTMCNKRILESCSKTTLSLVAAFAVPTITEMLQFWSFRIPQTFTTHSHSPHTLIMNHDQFSATILFHPDSQDIDVTVEMEGKTGCIHLKDDKVLFVFPSAAYFHHRDPRGFIAGFMTQIVLPVVISKLDHVYSIR